jgi:hypothetical protein
MSERVRHKLGHDYSGFGVRCALPKRSAGDPRCSRRPRQINQDSLLGHATGVPNILAPDTSNLSNAGEWGS